MFFSTYRRVILRCFVSVLVAAFFIPLPLLFGQQVSVKVNHVGQMPPGRNPELLYWFLAPDELEPVEYTKQIALVKNSGAFNFLFLTGRGSTNFYDFSRMHPIFVDLVAKAHAQGLKVGLQLWGRERDVPLDQVQGMVVENEVTVDAAGKFTLEASSRGVRMSPASKDRPAHPLYEAVRSEVLRVYAFKKLGDAEYAPGYLLDITELVKVSTPSADRVNITLTDPAIAGYTVYAMTVHYHRFPDIFAPYLSQSFTQALRAYQDVGFDGAALDEFRYMTVGKALDGKPFRERFYSVPMAHVFQKETGKELAKNLFEMRYVPTGEDVVRVRAINRYFELLREGVRRIEEDFYQATTQILGSKAFHGIHNTWHNGLEGDEVWGTGINWWTIPREYAQTDESTPMTTRLGMSMAHAETVEYNQYYSKDREKLLVEGLNDARYNGRVHYHALHDVQGWGIDIGRPDVLENIGRIQEKTRLLDAFNPGRPAVNVLFLFGFPALLNYDQPEGVRSEWDINAALKPEEKAVAAWNAGYRGVLAPTELLERGVIQVDHHGGMTYGGQRFTHVVMIGPEFSKASTLGALEKYVDGGGRLLLDGKAHLDFDGDEIDQRYAKLASKSVALGFSLENMKNLGVPILAMDEGASFMDGSVVLTDTESLRNDQPRAFSISLEGHQYTGTYEGLLAIHVRKDGFVDKLAGGHLDSLVRDGRPIIRLGKPVDIVLLPGAIGKLELTIIGDAQVKEYAQ